jgi:hypothetical protein
MTQNTKMNRIDIKPATLYFCIIASQQIGVDDIPANSGAMYGRSNGKYIELF